MYKKTEKNPRARKKPGQEKELRHRNQMMREQAQYIFNIIKGITDDRGPNSQKEKHSYKVANTYAWMNRDGGRDILREVEQDFEEDEDKPQPVKVKGKKVKNVLRRRVVEASTFHNDLFSHQEMIERGFLKQPTMGRSSSGGSSASGDGESQSPRFMSKSGATHSHPVPDVINCFEDVQNLNLARRDRSMTAHTGLNALGKLKLKSKAQGTDSARGPSSPTGNRTHNDYLEQTLTLERHMESILSPSLSKADQSPLTMKNVQRPTAPAFYPKEQPQTDSDTS